MQINDKNMVKARLYQQGQNSLSSINDYDYSNRVIIVWKHVFSSSMTVDVAALTAAIPLRISIKPTVNSLK
jgi:hypothetical protein